MWFSLLVSAQVVIQLTIKFIRAAKTYQTFSATGTSGDKGSRTTPDLLQGHSLHNSAAKLLENSALGQGQAGLNQMGLQHLAHLGQNPGLESLLTNLAATPQLGLGKIYIRNSN